MNAKKEFLKDIRPIDSPVLCAHTYVSNYNVHKYLKLPLFYTNLQWENFLADLNFDYDNDYGTQELFGTIWFLDGTWMERVEYDGSEWWELKKCPEIPKELHQRLVKE